MGTQMKDVRFTYLVLFAIALVVAVLGRIGLAVADVAGVLTYDYIAASTGTLLNQICTVLTGPSLVALLFSAGLALTLSTAGAALFGCWYARGARGLAKPGRALAAGGATALASLVCLAVPASGIMSAVQVTSMNTKLSLDGGMALMGVLFAVALVTLLAAASLVVCACIAQAKSPRRIGLNLVMAAAVCGLAVMVLAVCTFASVNVAVLDGMAAALWFGIDAAANVAMMAVATYLVRRGEARA